MVLKNPCLLGWESTLFYQNLIKQSYILCVWLYAPFPSLSDNIQTFMILLKPAGHTVADWVSISEIIGMPIYDIG